jgi:preprotein translocase subunit YajC
VPIAAGTSSGSFLPLLLIVVFIFGMYFLMIRPQQKRNRELQQMQSSIAPGSEVMTGSGIYGTVAPDVHIRVARAAIARVISAPDAAEDDSVDEDEVDHETDVTANPIIERQD